MYDLYYNIIDYNGVLQLTNDNSLKQRLLLNTTYPISITNNYYNNNNDNDNKMFYISLYNNTSLSLNNYVHFLEKNEKEYCINIYDEYFINKLNVKNIKNNIIEFDSSDNFDNININDKINIVINEKIYLKCE